MKSKALLTIVLLYLFCPASPAQTPRQTLCEEVVVNPEKWLKSPISYFITDSEQKSFRSLQNDADRESFILNFWLRRDSDPDTDFNEFKRELCERFDYANENFRSGLPGWRTDRGRIYLVLGNPDSVEKGRTGLENLEDVLYEKWFYQAPAATGGQAVEIVFADPTETNEFRFLRDRKEEVMRLVTPKGLRICY